MTGRDATKPTGWFQTEGLEYGGIKLRHWMERTTKYVQDKGWSSFDSKHIVCHVTCIVNEETGVVDARWPMITFDTTIGSYSNLSKFRNQRVIVQMIDDGILRCCAPVCTHAFIEERIHDLMDNYTIICNGGMTEWHEGQKHFPEILKVPPFVISNGEVLIDRAQAEGWSEQDVEKVQEVMRFIYDSAVRK